LSLTPDEITFDVALTACANTSSQTQREKQIHDKMKNGHDKEALSSNSTRSQDEITFIVSLIFLVELVDSTKLNN